MELLSAALPKLLGPVDEIDTFQGHVDEIANHRHIEPDPTTKEALRYRSALMQGLRELAKNPVPTGMAVEICRTLRGIAIDIRKVPGTALKNQTTDKVSTRHRRGP